MDPATSSYEAEGVAERRAQKELTERVGVSLVRRSKAGNFKWSTWKWRFGMRGQAPAAFSPTVRTPRSP